MLILTPEASKILELTQNLAEPDPELPRLYQKLPAHKLTQHAQTKMTAAEFTRGIQELLKKELIELGENHTIYIPIKKKEE